MTPLPTHCPACNAPAKLLLGAFAAWKCGSQILADGEFRQTDKCKTDEGDGDNATGI
jgi:hypothetical protein